MNISSRGFVLITFLIMLTLLSSVAISLTLTTKHLLGVQADSIGALRRRASALKETIDLLGMTPTSKRSYSCSSTHRGATLCRLTQTPGAFFPLILAREIFRDEGRCASPIPTEIKYLVQSSSVAPHTCTTIPNGAQGMAENLLLSNIHLSPSAQRLASRGFIQVGSLAVESSSAVIAGGDLDVGTIVFYDRSISLHLVSLTGTVTVKQSNGAAQICAHGQRGSYIPRGSAKSTCTFGEVLPTTPAVLTSFVHE